MATLVTWGKSWSTRPGSVHPNRLAIPATVEPQNRFRTCLARDMASRPSGRGRGRNRDVELMARHAYRPSGGRDDEHLVPAVWASLNTTGGRHNRDLVVLLLSASLVSPLVRGEAHRESRFNHHPSGYSRAGALPETICDLAQGISGKTQSVSRISRVHTASATTMPHP